MNIINTILKSYIIDKSLNVLIDGLINNLYPHSFILEQQNNKILLKIEETFFKQQNQCPTPPQLLNNLYCRG